MPTIPPRSPICPTLVRAWLRELLARPLEVRDIGPAFDPRTQDPQVALDLGPDGVPVWWPWSHPETRARLTRETRRIWFVSWMTDELWARRATLRRGARSYWRRVIAQALAITEAEQETWAIPYRPE